jgi:hypothetical protein
LDTNQVKFLQHQLHHATMLIKLLNLMQLMLIINLLQKIMTETVISISVLAYQISLGFFPMCLLFDYFPCSMSCTVIFM